MDELTRVGLLHAVGPHQQVDSTGSFDAWVLQFVELQLIAQVSPMVVEASTGDSPLDLAARILYRITREWKHVSGVVVLVPEAHALVVGAILEVHMAHVGKPIVLVPTATDSPHGVHELTFRSSVLNAVQVAGAAIAGVLLLAGGELLQPSQTNRLSPFAYESTTAGRYGRVDFGVQFSKTAPSRTDDPLEPASPFASDVEWIENAGPLDPLVVRSISDSVPGVVIRLDGEPPLSVAEDLPTTCPALVVTPEGVHLIVNGIAQALDGFRPAVAIAAFAQALAPRGASEDRVAIDRQMREILDRIDG